MTLGLPPAPLHLTRSAGDRGAAAFWLTTTDGLRLRAAKLAQGSRGTVMLLNGRAEFIEKYAHVAAHMAAQDYSVLTLDWRGQGLSQRLAPDPRLGHVADFAEYQLDLSALRAAAVTLGLARPHLVLAHSMGGCIALRALCTSWPEAAAVAFSAPMWELPLGRMTGLTARTLGRAAQLAGRATQPVPGRSDAYDPSTTPFDLNELTTDRGMFEHMQATLRAYPKLCVAAPTLGWLAAALRETRALSRLPAPALPAIAAVGTRETIVAPEAITARIAHWPGARLLRIDGAAHELMMESPALRDQFLNAACSLFDQAATHRD